MFDCANKMFASDKEGRSRRNHGQDCELDSRALSRRVGSEHRVLVADASGEAPLMAGCFTFVELRDGLYLHRTDVLHYRDMTTVAVIEEACVKVLLKLEGDARVRFGDLPLDLDAGQGTASRPLGAVVALGAPERFERRCRAASRERMVALTLTQNWLEPAGMDIEAVSRCGSSAPWRPSQHALGLAESLISTASDSGPLAGLQQECRAIELALEALSELRGHDGNTQPGRSRKRAERLKSLLDSGTADDWDLQAIAREMASNPTTLQREFQAAYGASIFEYIRNARLARAAHALEYRGVSVAVAAEIAGYSSQANFSTAFRKRYGFTPSKLRR